MQVNGKLSVDHWGAVAAQAFDSWPGTWLIMEQRL